ncbi:hypothetical protein ACFL5O_08165 [Myxococcota bacterium]
MVLVGAAIVAIPIWNARGTLPRSGDELEGPITLVASDRDDLDCAWSRSVGQFRCEFESPGRRWGDPPAPDKTLAPYYTLDRRFFLIPGLFENPSVAARYAQEPPGGVARNRLRRFVARCRLRLVERAKGVQVRWLRAGEWGSGPSGWVAQAMSCSVSDEEP